MNSEIGTNTIKLSRDAFSGAESMNSGNLTEAPNRTPVGVKIQLSILAAVREYVSTQDRANLKSLREPVFFVNEKSRELRMVCDYRALNKIPSKILITFRLPMNISLI